MLIVRHLICAAMLVLATGAALAQAAGTGCVTGRDGRMVCPPPDGRCATDRYGEVICSPSGGGVTRDRYDNVVCGPGQCVKDTRGDIFCSSAARGSAAVDNYGKAVCSESCVAASAAACVKPRAAN